MKRLSLVCASLVLVAGLSFARTFRIEQSIYPSSTVSTNSITVSSDIDWGTVDSICIVSPARSTGTVSIATSMLGSYYVLPVSYSITNTTSATSVNVYTPRRFVTENSVTNNERYPVFGNVSAIISKTGTSTNGWGFILFVNGD